MGGSSKNVLEGTKSFQDGQHDVCGQIVKNILFPCNAISTMLTLSIIWGGKGKLSLVLVMF